MNEAETARTLFRKAGIRAGDFDASHGRRTVPSSRSVLPVPPRHRQLLTQPYTNKINANAS